MSAPSTQIDARGIPGFNEAASVTDRAAIVAAYLRDCAASDVAPALDEGPA